MRVMDHSTRVPDDRVFVSQDREPVQDMKVRGHVTGTGLKV